MVPTASLAAQCWQWEIFWQSQSMISNWLLNVSQMGEQLGAPSLGEDDSQETESWQKKNIILGTP
jgi:hypothetical protein